ncbi:sulfite reductase (NADPH) flavoprotein alpha-component [Brevundimonas halotolerans]|uniref:NADPH--hemoprotein reductase n=2 Tax=Brevundimonas halotolerans TaxID=69670 RepID=A0A7W9A3C4_9CAUL|nr:sulfite reductase subunit alpha [Brevundimonas halotolerans]MBB5660573.1 sulfite reductase (NADPH) flavoprotein alpha-component [Brevundimonas halotolerans]
MGGELWAATAVLAWAGLTAWSLRPRPAPGAIAEAATLVVHASQTGSAEALAEETATALSATGLSVQRLGLSQLTPELLAKAERLFLIAATTGEGDAPDEATGFLRRLMPTPPDLSHLQVGVLALGDSSYGHYCGFGRALDSWLARAGATALFDRVEVDRLDPGALAHWRHQLTAVTGATFARETRSRPHRPWRLERRAHLNPGSPGRPVYRLRLRPIGDMPDWRAGDVAEVELPEAVAGQPGQLRDYSIATVPADRAMDLIIRETVRPDGTPGLASTWLLDRCRIGETVPLRIRPNRTFHGPDATGPLILIGNGTGLGGLVAHLSERARAAKPGPAWLVFGERTAAHDALLDQRLQGWLASGVLTRLDRAFSRDKGGARYVQDILQAEADTVRDWVERGATIMVCGSLKGMAPAVHAALRDILDEDRLLDLREAGRYRRDVY